MGPDNIGPGPDLEPDLRGSNIAVCRDSEGSLGRSVIEKERSL
jgi:hypothetical protein